MSVGLFGNTTFLDRMIGGLKAGIRREGFAAGWRYAKERAAAREENRRKVFGQAALRAYDYRARRQAQRSTDEVQYLDDEVRVVVRNGYSSDRDCYTTEIKVFHRDPNIHEHLHVVFDDRGQIIFENWRADKRRW